jgi:hypothetical protein
MTWCVVVEGGAGIKARRGRSIFSVSNPASSTASAAEPTAKDAREERPSGDPIEQVPTDRKRWGLAATGPTKSCRIGPPADIDLRAITAVLTVTPEAAAAWGICTAEVCRRRNEGSLVGLPYGVNKYLYEQPLKGQSNDLPQGVAI